MKRILYTGLALAAMVALSAPAFSAPTITITAPDIIFTDTTVPGLADVLNSFFDPTTETGAAFYGAIDKVETDTNAELEKYGEQKNLAKGFANANAYAAQSATLQGYQGYKLFALMGGVMVGGQLPSLDPNELTQIANTIEDNPDVYAGAAPSASFVNIGLNAGRVFGLFNDDLGNALKNFYVNFKFGSLGYAYSMDEGDLEMNSTNVGVGVNYQWLPQSRSVMFGLFRWRGVNFGTGFNYQANTIDFSTTVPEISQAFTQQVPVTFTKDGTTYTTDANVSGTLVANPEVDLAVEMKTFSVPLEASTSMQLLWILNLNFGAGFDLVFGNADIIAKADSRFSAKNVTVTSSTPGLDIPVTVAMTDGSVKLDASTKGISPSLTRARLMTGVGLQAGPLKIDVPVYYYFNTGLALGVSVGIVW